MMEKLRHKYALSEKGAKDMVRAFIAVTISNLVLMLPVGLLYKLSSYLLEGELKNQNYPFYNCNCYYTHIDCINSTFTI